MMKETKTRRHSFTSGSGLWCPAVSLAIVFLLFSCKESDDVPPVITLTGDAQVTSVLNESYNDPGASATDDTDGNITGRIQVKSQVNVNRVGTYIVEYSVTDEAGNLALPVTRDVGIVNTSASLAGLWAVSCTGILPSGAGWQYETVLDIDSAKNNRVIFSVFADDMVMPVYADVASSQIIVPYQSLGSGDSSISIQGFGTATDTSLSILYTKKNLSTIGMGTMDCLKLTK
jgi:hypothetical protein